MASSTSDMRLCGGHAALDLANTVDSRRGRWGPDFLRSFSDFLVLAERIGVLDRETAVRLSERADAHPDQARVALARAIDLRENIYRLFIAEDVAASYPPAELDAISGIAREGRCRTQLQSAESGLAWQLPFDELEDVTRAFAIAAVDLLIARNSRREVRECKGEYCGWLFIDHSKGGRRLWCSDASCGTRSRIARFRARSSR